MRTTARIRKAAPKDRAEESRAAPRRAQVQATASRSPARPRRPAETPLPRRPPRVAPRAHAPPASAAAAGGVEHIFPRLFTFDRHQKNNVVRLRILRIEKSRQRNPTKHIDAPIRLCYCQY